MSAAILLVIVVSAAIAVFAVPFAIACGYLFLEKLPPGLIEKWERVWFPWSLAFERGRLLLLYKVHNFTVDETRVSFSQLDCQYQDWSSKLIDYRRRVQHARAQDARLEKRLSRARRRVERLEQRVQQRSGSDPLLTELAKWRDEATESEQEALQNQREIDSLRELVTDAEMMIVAIYTQKQSILSQYQAKVIINRALAASSVDRTDGALTVIEKIEKKVNEREAKAEEGLSRLRRPARTLLEDIERSIANREANATAPIDDEDESRIDKAELVIVHRETFATAAMADVAANLSMLLSTDYVTKLSQHELKRQSKQVQAAIQRLAPVLESSQENERGLEDNTRDAFAQAITLNRKANEALAKGEEQAQMRYKQLARTFVEASVMLEEQISEAKQCTGKLEETMANLRDLSQKIDVRMAELRIKPAQDETDRSSKGA